jgi:hypothetical protein
VNLREVIVLTAMYYEKSLSEPLLEMYLGDLSDLPENKVCEAYALYRRNPKNRTFPLPAQIREILQPQVSDDTLAREATARIVESITRFGYMRGSEAKMYIGELGWNVVQRFGGWQYICENHGLSLNPGTFLAQARDIAKSHIEMSRAGSFGEAPSLPSSRPVLTIDHKPKGLQQAASVDLFGDVFEKGKDRA